MNAGSSAVAAVPPRWRVIHAGWPWLMVAIGAVVIAFTFGQYGITWDEGGQAQYGRYALEYLKTGTLSDEAAAFLQMDFSYYGPLLEMIPWLLCEDEQRIFDVRHLFFGLIALLAIPGLAAFARSGAKPDSRADRALLPLPLLAVLALATMPAYYGHWTNNSKDVPFAVATIWFMAAAARIACSRRMTWPQTLASGAALGAALCVRPGGLPMLVLLLAVALALGHRSGTGIHLFERGWRTAAGLLLKLGCMLALAWVIMLLPWRLAWDRPIGHPLESIHYSFGHRRHIPMLFEGNQVFSDTLPWHYLPKMIAITAPPAVLVFAGLGAVVSVCWICRQPQSRRTVMYGIALAWLAIPLAMFILMRPAIYDGIRHFFFVLPALAILAGVGAAHFGFWILHFGLKNGARMVNPKSKIQNPKWLALIATILALILLLPVGSIIKLHPYESTYYNMLVGGVRRAANSYETDYWIASYREAMNWVNQQARQAPQRRFGVWAAGPQFAFACVGPKQEPNVDVMMIEPQGLAETALPPHVDFYIASTRFEYDQALPRAPVVHAIGREGAVFTVIKGR